MIFYDGKAHKFDDVTFNRPEDYCIGSASGVWQDDGTAILDDGTKIEVKDLVCFAEKVRNKY